MSYDFSFHSLLDQYEKTQHELKAAEYSIRRLTGRDPGEDFSNAGSKFRKNSTMYVGERRKRNLGYPLTLDRGKESDIYEEEEEDDDDDDDEPPLQKKPTLQSTIVAKKIERSRYAAIKECAKSPKMNARNKRLFHVLVAGTLEKFKDEEKKRMSKEAMRASIVEKVENATLLENLKIKEEKEELFRNRQRKKMELRCLEKKLERAESHEMHELNHHFLEKFIQTKSKPQIFFLPSTHTTATKKCLEESRSKIQELIRERKRCLEQDISEIEECYRKDSLPGDKENACPKDESESQDVPESESESLVVEQEDVGLENDDSNGKNVETVNNDQDFEPIYD